MRKNPEKVTAATQGAGSTSHLTAELFQLMAKVKLRQIPYRGSAPALQGLLAGDVDLMFDNLGVSLPLVEDGKLRLLAVASAQRMPSLPAVPTLAETLPGFEAVAWYAIMAPPNTPKAIVDKINDDVNQALRQPDMQDRLRKLSAEVFGGSPERTRQYIQQEIERWGKVIDAAQVKLHVGDAGLVPACRRSGSRQAAAAPGRMSAAQMTRQKMHLGEVCSGDVPRGRDMSVVAPT